MKNILITGAQLVNRGAQSMLFITTSELKSRFKDCNVYFATNQSYDETQYTFIKVYDSALSKKIAVGQTEIADVIRLIKNILRLLRGKPNNLNSISNLFKIKDIKKLLPKLDLIIDVSGFALGNQWPISRQEDYLLNIEMAKKNSIPMILMPQSFGLFDEKIIGTDLIDKIKQLLSYPDVIFAREEEGYDILVNQFGLTNTVLSNDLVLQNRGINSKFIFKNSKEDALPEVFNNSVAVIPNVQCIYHGNEDVLKRYNVIIDSLLQKNLHVYIFWHSKEDQKMCEDIYRAYRDNSNVILLENDFSCLEYDELVGKFNFIVCSRYHGIVHAYRNYVPAIILGWAVKYTELAGRVDQGQYVFNIINSEITDSELINVINNMADNYIKESKIIKNNVDRIQADNCFDFLDNYK